MIELEKSWSLKIFDWVKKTMLGLHKDPVKLALREIHEIDSVFFGGFQPIKNLLLDWDVGESKTLDGVYAMLIRHDEKEAWFLEAIPPGNKFLEHWHPCPEELIVLEGHVVDPLSKVKTIGKGQSFLYDRMQRHKPGNASDNEFAMVLVKIKFK